MTDSCRLPHPPWISSPCCRSSSSITNPPSAGTGTLPGTVLFGISLESAKIHEACTTKSSDPDPCCSGRCRGRAPWRGSAPRAAAPASHRCRGSPGSPRARRHPGAVEGACARALGHASGLGSAPGDSRRRSAAWRGQARAAPPPPCDCPGTGGSDQQQLRSVSDPAAEEGRKTCKHTPESGRQVVHGSLLPRTVEQNLRATCLPLRFPEGQSPDETPSMRTSGEPG
jgi:hypothetical protein